MPLATPDQLGAIEAALPSAAFDRLDGLTVQDSGGGAAGHDQRHGAGRRALRRAGVARCRLRAIDGSRTRQCPRDEVARDHPPLGAAAGHVADGIDHLPKVGSRAPKPFSRGQQRLQDRPLCVGDIGWIRETGMPDHALNAACRTFHTAFKCRIMVRTAVFRLFTYVLLAVQRAPPAAGALAWSGSTRTLSTLAGRLPGRVSYIWVSTTKLETKVRAAMPPIAQGTPSRSATTPAISAPMAYPPSRQRRYTPTAEARQSGCATSEMAASNVGYTRAVPSPSSPIATAQTGKLVPRRMSKMPLACIHIPPTIIPLRPSQSDRAPVPS